MRKIVEIRQIASLRADGQLKMSQIKGLVDATPGGHVDVACIYIQVEGIRMMWVQVSQRAARHLQIERLFVERAAAFDAEGFGVALRALLVRFDCSIHT